MSYPSRKTLPVAHAAGQRLTRSANRWRCAAWMAGLVLTCGLSGVPAVARGDDPAPGAEASRAASPARVAEWVAQLASPRRGDRERARAALLALGPEVLPSLPDPQGLADAAAREAVHEVRTLLEQRRAAESLEPGLVTWSGTATVTELAAVILQQTGNRVEIDVGQVEGPSLAVAWRNRTFWGAIDELLQRGGLVIAAPTGDHVLRLALPPQVAEERAGLPLMAGEAGAVRWEVVRLETRPGGIEGGPDLLRIEYRLRVEPRLRPLFADYREAELVAAVAGRPLIPFNPQARRQPDFSRAGETEFAVDYVSPSAAAGDRLSVAGRCEIEYAAAPQEVLLRPFAGPWPVSRRAGSVLVSLDEVRAPVAHAPAAAGARAAFRVTFRYDAGGPVFESHRVATVHREVLLQLPDGRRIPVNDGYELARELDGALSALYRFRDLPVGWRDGALVCETPTAILREAVTWEGAAPLP